MTPHGAEHEPNDPLIESCLEEILGGHAPPDLTEQILSRHAERGGPVVPPPTLAATSAPPVQVATRNVAVRRRPRFSRSGSRSRSWILVAVLTTTVAIGLLALVGFNELPNQQPDRQPNVALSPSSADPAPPAPIEFESPTDQAIARQIPASDSVTRASQPRVTVPPAQPEPDPATQVPGAPIRLASKEVVRLIDEQVQRNLEIANVGAASMISDETWCRRVYQRLLGRTVSNEELRRFTGTAVDRRSALLDQLFNEERYRKEYASHWSTLWTDQLLSHALATKNADSLRTGLRRYLQTAFLQNLPHDEWAAELIAAEGSNSLQDADYNGATNYLLALRDEDGVRVASEVCRVFLGQRVQCAQCHDDRQSNRPQQSFWELTAFFRQLDAETIRPGKARLVDRDFAGDPGAEAGAVRFQRHKDGSWQEALPRFLDETEINASGKVAVTNRRREFARWMTKSTLFSEAAVNRVWAHLLAFGFTSPVDDMGRHNPAGHPELLASLAQQFELHDFDTPQLMRWIVMSEPFNRAEVITAANGKDAPLLGSMAYFSRFYYRPVFFSGPMESLAGLTNNQAKTAMLQVPGIDLMLNAQIQQLLDDDQANADKGNQGKVDAFGEQLSSGQKRLAVSLAKGSMSRPQEVEHIFLAILGRQPTPSELESSISIYESAQTPDRISTVEKLIWALTRTSEYVKLH